MNFPLPSLQFAVRTGRAFLPRDYWAPELAPAMGHLYFWKLSNTEIIKVFPELADMLTDDSIICKIGYAGAVRKYKSSPFGLIGAVARCRETIRAWENMAGLPAGSLLARLYAYEIGTVEETMAAETFLHERNQGTEIHFEPWVLAKCAEIGGKRPSGSSELYLTTIQSLWGKFMNCQTRRNKALGWEAIHSSNAMPMVRARHHIKKAGGGDKLIFAADAA